MSAPEHQAFLDPAALNRAEALGLLARRVVEGYKVGEHRSPLKGFAIEFAQHREYALGDDVRHLDWKVLGRSDKLYLKQYEQDTNYVAHLLVDTSGSMAYGSGAYTKLHYAKLLAATLAHVILGQRDAVTLGLLGEGPPVLLPRTDTPQRLPLILDTLARAEAAGTVDLAAQITRLAPAIKRRSIVILIGDFLDGDEALLAALPRLRFQNCETIVFHVLDHAELELPFDDNVRFDGLEGEPSLTTRPADFREAYKSEVKAFCDNLRIGCERADAHYVLADTSQPLAEVLGGYLAFRNRTRT
ncbi:MAG: DUF58 domain-containing protein [Verrucomicrobiota bacterium]